MLESAAWHLLTTGAEFWADGKLDWDYTVLGAKLVAAARAVGAQSQRMLSLPMVLPARGKRPPAMLRIGVMYQAANLLKKVTPRYPQEARQRRVSGTVRILSLIGLDGKVMDLQLVSGPPELVDVALDAARQWVCKPTL